MRGDAIAATLAAVLGHWRRHPMQLFALIAGLALATALWSGVQALNAEARSSYARAAGLLGQDQFDRILRTDGRPMDIAVFRTLRQSGYLVSPVIEGRLGSGPNALRLLGIDPLTLPVPALPETLQDGTLNVNDFLLEGRVLMSEATLARGLPPDLTPSVESRLMAATLDPNLATGLVIGDVATIARFLGHDGATALIAAAQQPLGLPPITDWIALRDEVVLQRAETSGDLERLTDSFHLNLTAFGFLAFAVGLFITHATIGLAFEQRRATIRSLRAMGVPLRPLILLLAGELGLLALVAGGLGLALGYGLAASLLPEVSASLQGLYGADIDSTLGFDPIWAVTALAMSLGGALIAGASALWRMAQLPILQSATPNAWGRASAQLRRLQGGIGVALLGLALGVALFGQGLILGFAGLAALLLGSALILPVFLATVLRIIANQTRDAYVHWIFADMRLSLPALSLSLMALLLALSTNIGVSTMVGSFRDTFTGWLDQRLASEMYLTTATPEQAAAVTAFLEPRVAAILPFALIETRFGGLPAQLHGLIDHATYRDHWPFLEAADQAWSDMATGQGVVINEQLARRDGYRLGDLFAVTPNLTLPILGIYSDYGNPEGQAIIGLSLFQSLFPDTPILRFALRTDPNRVTELAAEITAATGLSPQSMINQTAVKDISLRVFEQTFQVTYALNALTLGVAGFAIFTSLLTLSDMRLVQIAPIWAAGQRRRILAGTEMLRILAFALFCSLFALPVGFALAHFLLAIINVEAFGWRLPMSVFPTDLLKLGAMALCAAGISAIWPAWKLARLSPHRLLGLFAHER
ncbi:FtsX-like permease family protein [Rhodobacteraceae bacterium XHP0102]|nr:FtsX-like permease family protein [Rhodobacteraceae bacterium XHP0102]